MFGEGGRSIEEQTVITTPQVCALPIRPLESLLAQSEEQGGVPLRAKKACFAFHAPRQLRTPAAPKKMRAATALWADGRRQNLKSHTKPKHAPLPARSLPWSTLVLPGSTQLTFHSTP